MQWWGESILQFLGCLYQHSEDRMLRSEEEMLIDDYTGKGYTNDAYIGEDRSPQYWVCA